MRGPIPTTPYNYRQRPAAGAAGGGRGLSRVNYGRYYNEEEEEDEDQIRKGPWKAEEDEVLINHVSKYGPRDWSSIRSKGLLRRTGKSCRLRWVNKLRPDLKNGCKFSAEEERVVIEMQAEIGNKWATIATYLPGRTDNDVKNFWSSRQKRLARMRHASCSSANPPPPSSDAPHDVNKCNGGHENVNADVDVPSLEVPECGVEAEEMGASICTFRPDQCTTLFSAYISHEPESLKMVELPALMMMSSGPLTGEGAEAEGATGMAAPMTTATETASELGMAPFPPLYDNALPMTQPLLPFPAEELLDPAMEEPSFMDIFGAEAESGDDVMFGQESESGIMSCNSGVVQENGGDLKTPPVTFFDDFPSDMLDQMESLDRLEDSLPSPSQW